MLVEGLLPTAREKLVTIGQDAPLIEAARLLRAGTDLVVVQAPGGALAGIITKTDVVAQISHCQGASCVAPASAVMTRDVVLCRPKDWLNEIWSRMQARGLKNAPIVDDGSRPLGVLTARDALQMLLRETANEEALLRDYVMSVGYR